MDDEPKGNASPLPGVVGALAKAADTGPSKALLGPAAKVFGMYLGRRAEETVAGWERKREANVNEHHRRVLEREGSAIPREPTEKQVKLINEWIEGAQQVDPDDPEIAALWQGLLGAIYRKANDAGELLDIIKELDQRDARIIVGLGGTYVPRSSYEKQRANKLARLGVLESFDMASFLRVQLPLFGAIASSSVFLPFLPDDVFLIPIHPSLFRMSFMMMLVLSIFLFAVNLLNAIRRYNVTELGQTLRISAQRYLKPKMEQSDREIATDTAKSASRTA